MHSFQKMCGAPSTFFTKKNVAWLMLFLSALAAASLLGGRGSEPDRDARAQQRRLGATLVNFMDPKSVRERFLEYEDPVTVSCCDHARFAAVCGGFRDVAFAHNSTDLEHFSLSIGPNQLPGVCAHENH